MNLWKKKKIQPKGLCCCYKAIFVDTGDVFYRCGFCGKSLEKQEGFKPDRYWICKKCGADNILQHDNVMIFG